MEFQRKNDIASKMGIFLILFFVSMSAIGIYQFAIFSYDKLQNLVSRNKLEGSFIVQNNEQPPKQVITLTKEGDLTVNLPAALRAWEADISKKKNEEDRKKK